MKNDKSMDTKSQYEITGDGKVPFKLAPTDPPKSKTQGQKEIQVKKKPFKGVF